MRVLVDTCVWSEVLRRRRRGESKLAQALASLIMDQLVELLGPIRQELLSGVKEEDQFNRLEQHLAAFPDLELVTDDYVTAARFYNTCRAKGVQGSNTDFLICAAAHRRELPIFTTDKDFARYAKHLPIELYKG